MRTHPRCEDDCMLLHCMHSVIHSVWWSLLPSAIQTLIASLVLSILDYDNVSLTGIPGYLLRHLQSVLNAAARIISGLPRSAHISTLLANLHWLRSAERIKFKLATLTFSYIQGSDPWLLSADFTRVADVQSRRRLYPIVSSFGNCDSSPSVIMYFQSQTLTCGTVFLTN